MKRVSIILLIMCLSIFLTACGGPESIYKKAQKAQSEGKYTEAAELYESTNGYEDSANLAMYCKALAFADEGKYTEATTTLTFLGDYKDSVQLIYYYELCHEAFVLRDINNILNAADKFEEIAFFKDSAVKAEQARQRVYELAVSFMDNGDYEDAMSVFYALEDYKDSVSQIENCKSAIKEKKYENAVMLLNNGKYYEAKIAFAAMDGYKDSSAQIEICKAEIINSAIVGSTVYFGYYEQDNIESNGREELEWIVLAKENGKILLISEYAIDFPKYNNYDDENVTWETCTLRKWLNETFFDVMFNELEKNMIVITNVTADINSKYSLDSGNDTQDKVFLLSVVEADKYFNSDLARKCKPTEYAKTQKKSYSYNGNCSWYLRTRGIQNDRVTYVSYDGTISYLGDSACIGYIGTRPALWINQNS